MALSNKDALDVVRQILGGPRATEAPRLARIDNALATALPGQVFDSQIPWSERTDGAGDGFFSPTVTMPPNAPAIYHELAYKTHTDFLRLVVKEFAQTIKVDGYLTDSDPGAKGPWFWWQRNQMDAKQTGLTRSALKYGVAYALAYPADFSGVRGSSIRCFSPKQMTAVYANEGDEWPMFALYTDRLHTVLLDESSEYRFGVKDPSTQQLISPFVWSNQLDYIETRTHGAGFTPVVRYLDRWLPDGEQEFGIVEPLLLKQQHIDQIEYEKAVAQYTTAFRQRYVTGWVPEDADQALKQNPGAVWYVAAEDEDGKAVNISVGEFSQTDLSGYIQAGSQARRDLSAMAQISMASLGIDGISNTSGDAMEALNNSRNNESSEIATSLGESHEQLLRLCAMYEGDEKAANDYSSEVRWKDFNSRTYAQMVDGLTKLVGSQIITPSDAVDDIPGMTDQRAARIRSNAQQQAASERLAALSQAAGSASGDPAAADARTGDTPAEMKAKFEAMGMAIRAGVKPQAAAAQVGLTGVEFTNMVPVTLRDPGSTSPQPPASQG